MNRANADRELRVESVVNAAPDEVWALLTDFSQMSSWSPELVKMLPLTRGGLRVGQHYLGINRRKAAIWPTRSVVAELEPGRLVSWDTRSSGARWIWELEPLAEGATQVVHRRTVPQRLTRMSGVFAGVFLGGAVGHADELEAAMATTLERLKAAAEA